MVFIPNDCPALLPVSITFTLALPATVLPRYPRDGGKTASKIRQQVIDAVLAVFPAYTLPEELMLAPSCLQSELALAAWQSIK